MDIGTANVALAASITDRAHDLIQDGWVKGAFYGGEGKVQTFCILGALDLACQEMLGTQPQYGGFSLFGKRGNTFENAARDEIMNIASSFILDEALAQCSYKGHSIPGFNDSSERQLQQVLSVLSSASKRLWDISVAENEDVGFKWEPSKWAHHDVPEAKAFMQNALVAV